MPRLPPRLGLCSLFALGSHLPGAPIPEHLARDDVPYYADYRQSDFPFVETTLDLRGLAPTGSQTNLVPRALVLPLGDDLFVGFDTELLRVVAIWQGDFITPNGMAMLSYAVPLRKLPTGQFQLPQPQGDIAVATDLYPGWQDPSALSFDDPRSRGVDPAELGRGPLPADKARWRAIDDHGTTATLHYTVGKVAVAEQFSAIAHAQRPFVSRRIQLGPHETPLACVIAQLDETATSVPLRFGVHGATLSVPDGRHVIATIPASRESQVIRITYALDGLAIPADLPITTTLVTDSVKRAAVSATTRMIAGEPQGAYAVDELLIPYPNPWQRRIRPMDIDFLPSGEAVMVTFDGDVFRMTGLDASGDGSVTLRRIASGLGEPQSIRRRGEELFVFTRLGLTRLVDLDGDDDIDRYEMFSNAFVQSAETRAFPLSMVPRADGSFLLSIGGQQDAHAAPHAGRAVHVSAAGEFLGVHAEGLRNGYLSALGETDRVIATDQQGNWVPATPMLEIREGKFYGFEPGTTHSREVESVPLWIPHRFAQSGIDLVTVPVDNRQLGDLAGSVLMVDFYKPGLLKILGASADPLIQAVAMPLPVEFEVPMIKGNINPVDGLGYFAGMQIWSSIAPRIEGLCRLRAIAPHDGLPIAAEAHAEGIRLQFSQPLDPTHALEPSNYNVNTWFYRRTAAYGSGYYRADGTPGVDQQSVHTVLLSADRKTVFLAIANMLPVDQLELEYQRPEGPSQKCFFTINALTPLDPLARVSLGVEDFATLFAAAPAPRAEIQRAPSLSVERGREIYTLFACIGCHSLDGTTEGFSGPSWKGIYQNSRLMASGRQRTANSNYLRESIMDPTKHIVAGYDQTDVAMPSYRGILTTDDVDSLIMFIETLGDTATPPSDPE